MDRLSIQTLLLAFQTHSSVVALLALHTVALLEFKILLLLLLKTGVVGWCEGVMYLMSPGRPADIGLQVGKACYP